MVDTGSVDPRSSPPRKSCGLSRAACMPSRTSEAAASLAMKGTPYPAIMLVSGTNDPRVNPGDSRRFAARLQSATSSGRPVLLRVSGAGHVGTALSGGLAQIADIYTFLFWQLGVDYRAVKA